MEAQNLLVDSHHGIYCWQVLAERFPLFRQNGEPISDTLKAELIDVDSEDYWDVVEYECDEIYVRHESGLLYHIEQIEGDIWAIHPDAKWSETFENYYVVNGEDYEFTVPEIVPYFLEYGTCGDGDEYQEDDKRLTSFFDMRYNWAKAFAAGFYDVVEESGFSWGSDVIGWKGDATIDVVVRVATWKACR